MWLHLIFTEVSLLSIFQKSISEAGQIHAESFMYSPPSITSIPLPENAFTIELPDLLSTFFLFQKSLQNPWHLIHSLNLRYQIRGHNLTHIFAVDMFPYKITEPFQWLGFTSQLPKKPGNTPLFCFYSSFLDINTTHSTCNDTSILMSAFSLNCPYNPIE